MSDRFSPFLTSLDDMEAEARIQQMIEHINKESDAQVREIYNEGLSDSSAAIILSKGRENVDRYYKDKIVQLEKETVSAISAMAHEGKMRILNAKNDHVKELVDEVYERLLGLQNNSKKYTSILESLIMQSLCRLLEKRVNLVLRQKDVKLVQTFLASLEKNYQKMTGLEVTIKVDPDITLPENHAGGVLVNAKKKTIFVDNSLLIRLQHLTTVRFPFVHRNLFH
ncbi:uncharacterized protein LOC126843017 [Adelges cooleyi]|uniref:uncharacterized protein LOC126843017 n=1 Tax=Adelges cooleyi TaxID=133065 RepID=UPI00217F9D5C|nr:uncharacterized protein LOC126843017 [Adelges cooleyi]